MSFFYSVYKQACKIVSAIVLLSSSVYTVESDMVTKNSVILRYHGNYRGNGNFFYRITAGMVNNDGNTVG